MSVNLLDLLSNPAGQALIKQASGFLGENESTTSNALKQAIPGLLGGLLKKSTDQDGTKGIMDFITNNNVDGGILDDVVGSFAGDGVSNILNMGGGITDFIFGGGNNKAISGVIDLITQKSGLNLGSAGNLLKIAAPFVLGRIGKEVKSNGLDIAGLGKLLLGQRKMVKDQTPEIFGALGLASTGNWMDKLEDKADDMGDAVSDTVNKAGEVVGDAASAVGGAAMSTVDKAGELAGDAVDAVGDAASAVGGAAKATAEKAGELAGDAVDTVGDAAKATGQAAEKAVKAGASGIGKILPWIIVALIAFAILMYMKQCQPAKVVDQAAEAVENTVEKTGEVISDAGEAVAAMFKSVKLPSGKEIQISTESFMNKFVDVLDGATWDLSKPFIANDIKFESGSTTLTAESMDVVNNLADIMGEYPNLELRLEGHTDVTGDTETNMTISEQRALAVKKILTDHGVAASRIDAVGMGESHPLESNHTEEGKAENRRVEIYITKK